MDTKALRATVDAALYAINDATRELQTVYLTVDNTMQDSPDGQLLNRKIEAGIRAEQSINEARDHIEDMLKS